MSENFDDMVGVSNETIETIIARDVKMAYGMPLEIDAI